MIWSSFVSEKFRQKIQLLRTIHTGFENPWFDYFHLMIFLQFTEFLLKSTWINFYPGMMILCYVLSCLTYLIPISLQLNSRCIFPSFSRAGVTLLSVYTTIWCKNNSNSSTALSQACEFYPSYFSTSVHHQN